MKAGSKNVVLLMQECGSSHGRMWFFSWKNVVLLMQECGSSHARMWFFSWKNVVLLMALLLYIVDLGWHTHTAIVLWCHHESFAEKGMKAVMEIFSWNCYYAS
jgi:hypothetical protein